MELVCGRVHTKERENDGKDFITNCLRLHVNSSMSTRETRTGVSQNVPTTSLV